MAQKKYYGVRTGRQPGVYSTWAECQAQVHGYPNASFKAFPTEQEAAGFVAGRPQEKPAAEPSGTGCDIYVDGTYRQNENRYGWAFVAYDGGRIVHTDSGLGDNDAAAVIRNVAGELSATMRAIKWAKDNGVRPVTIHHDYAGIAAWAVGDWKANNPFTQAYAAFIRPHLSWVAFNKVTGHAGVEGNELADKLAREALNKGAAP
jgi:ribonuclease HI